MNLSKREKKATTTYKIKINLSKKNGMASNDTLKQNQSQTTSKPTKTTATTTIITIEI